MDDFGKSVEIKRKSIHIGQMYRTFQTWKNIRDHWTLVKLTNIALIFSLFFKL
jgi:hypothetical protein